MEMKDILFSNAVAISRMNTLLSKERINRIADAEDLESAVKVLLEANYGNGIVLDSYTDYEVLLEAERKNIDAFAHELIPESSGVECFYLFADYHNVKVLLRQMLENKDFSHLLREGGIYDIEFLSSQLEQDKPDINEHINSIAMQVKESYESVSPRKIDTMLDLAMLRDIGDRISKPFVSKHIREYFGAYIDNSNIVNALRTLKITDDFEYYSSMFIDGGMYSMEEFRKVFEDPSRISEIANGTVFENCKHQLLDMPISELDAIKETGLLSNIIENRNDMLSEAPSLAFYLLKHSEIGLARYLLICIKNKVSKEIVQKRLRSLYA